MDLGVLASYKLPQPDSSWTIPIAIGLGVLALVVLVRKLVVLAVVLALLAAGFIAYQNGAFDKWVDKGKVVIDENVKTG
jgi:hypothetical protein